MVEMLSIPFDAITARAKELAEEDGEMWHFLLAQEKNYYYSLASHELAPNIKIN